MSFFDQTEAGSLGLKPRTVDVRLHLVNTAEAEANLTEGQVCVLDRTRSSSETTNSRPGASGSRWVNGVTPLESLDHHLTGTFLVALEAVTKGTEGKFRLTGYARASVVNTGANASAGGYCTPVNSEAYLESTPASQTSGAKFIFELDEASTDATETLLWGWFDGE